MRNRLLTGLAAGALLGAAASLMAMPKMDYRTRRRVNRMGKRMAHRLEDIVEDLRDYMK
ncbi:hypothetical protein [Thermobrachium celere]|uniref:YtxH domain-containing protein n=1 Tax=Thermobrachium celere DSM 8682 TaxID=941824 RepID=R7RTE1_9CLOT|nr:hypothetical protein [Thermobrachium celere]GFR34352.1 hypothetical protein TCEA9_01640 [Thermobrachium celere]CDF58518.1 hypothetical protein TCEL_00564 [Thermobrachium celere DSM 8682]